jgi:hypothetical protein
MTPRSAVLIVPGISGSIKRDGNQTMGVGEDGFDTLVILFVILRMRVQES